MSLHLVLRSQILMLLTAVACDTQEQAGADAGPPTIEIGTGERDFESLRDGDSVFIVQGPQDGYHIFGSVQATNVNEGNVQYLSDPTNPRTTFEVYQGLQRVDAMASSYQQGLRPSPAGVEMVGRTVILDIESDSDLAGMELRFVVTIEDYDGVVVSDERLVQGIAHPNNN